MEGRQGVFFSVQATASFPEGGASAGLAIQGHTEARHSETQARRRNINELRAYLHQQSLAPPADAHGIRVTALGCGNHTTND